MTELSRYIAGLSPEQLALLSRRMKRKGELQPSRNTILPRRSGTEALPLSFAQQRLWFLDKLVPNNPFYNIPAALHLTGSLNRQALEESLTEIIRRHEALRTRFEERRRGQVQQVVMTARAVEMPLVDLAGVGEAERDAEVRKLIAEEARRSFDLSNGPLLRTKLLRLNANEHVLLLTMHHIVADNWSTGVLVRELATLYDAFSSERQSPLAELPVQYADYAIWQREWLQGKVLHAQLSYWQKQLANLPVVKLPTDRPRPAVQTFRGAIHPYELSPSLSAALRELSRHEGTTLYMTMLAAYNVMLYRYTGQEDIVVGSPIANRNRAEIEGLIGFFANMLVMRTNLTGHPTFRQLLQRVKRETLDAHAHQDTPFEKLVEELQPERDMSRTPLFQVVFALSNAPMPQLDLPGLTLRHMEVETGAAMFDLILGMIDREPSLSGLMLYNTDLFDAATIARMLGHYTNILEAVVAEPDCYLIDIPLDADASAIVASGAPAFCPDDEAEQFNL